MNSNNLVALSMGEMIVINGGEEKLRCFLDGVVAGGSLLAGPLGVFGALAAAIDASDHGCFS